MVVQGPGYGRNGDIQAQGNFLYGGNRQVFNKYTKRKRLKPLLTCYPPSKTAFTMF
jgi:hypothetical protein